MNLTFAFCLILQTASQGAVDLLPLATAFGPAAAPATLATSGSLHQLLV